MSKGKWILTFFAACICLLNQTGCDQSAKQQSIKEAEEAKAELANLKTTLEKTQSDKEALRADVNNLSNALQKTESSLDLVKLARDGLLVRVYEITKSRDELQDQVNKLTETRDALQKRIDRFTESERALKSQVEELCKSRDMLKQYTVVLTGMRDDLKKQVAEITYSRDAAVADAAQAQAKVKQLTAQLQRHLEQIIKFQDQIRRIQFSVDILKLKICHAPAKTGQL
jgi:chromosome segregation ATPase